MMSKNNIIKVSKRGAIILLIAVFSIAGFTSCKKNVTNPILSQESVTITDVATPGDANTSPEPTPEPEQPAFSEDTYYKIYAPYGKGLSAEEGWVTNVSYQDSETLTKLWKEVIEGGRDNDGKRWIIRDANNRKSDPKTAHYYYFDKDFNIVYHRQDKGSIMVRKFIGGIIAQYRGKKAGTYAIGGIYETVLDKNEITGNGWDSLNIFMGDRDMRAKKGSLEVLTMNTGYAFDNDTEFGVDFYYNRNKEIREVEEYTSRTPEELNSFFSGARNLSWKPGYVNYKFVSSEPYAWHLEAHPESGWVQR